MCEISIATRVISKIILTFSISIISYHYFEKPAREYLNNKNKKSIAYLSFLIIVLVTIAISYNLRSDSYLYVIPSKVKAGGYKVRGDIKNPSIVLMGDSNAGMYGYGIKCLAEKLNFRANLIGVEAGDVLPGSILWKDCMSFLRKEKPDFVVFVNFWSSKLNGDFKKLDTAVKEIEKYSKFVVLITQPPILPGYASREKIRTYGIREIYEENATRQLRNKTNTYILSLKGENIIVIDCDQLFTSPNGNIFLKTKDGKRLYQDSGHLSGEGGRLVIQNLLIPELGKHLIGVQK